MKLLEKILAILVIILMVASLIFLIPYSALLITVFSIVLGSIYFYLSFALLNNIRLRNAFKKSSYKGISAIRLIGSVLTGIVLSLNTVYILFVFQRWPFGKQGLFISLILLSIIIIIVLAKAFSRENKFYFGFSRRLILFWIIGVGFYILPSETILEIRYRDYPDYIKAEKEAMENPTNRELQLKAQEEREKIDLKN